MFAHVYDTLYTGIHMTNCEVHAAHLGGGGENPNKVTIIICNIELKGVFCEL